jgi:hypothetical protein
MSVLDLQGLTTEMDNGGGHGGGGGSTLTLLGCASHTPSNISALLCH